MTRMIDMGVKPFLVAAACRCVLAQRLVRRFCKNCGQPHELHKDEINALQVTEDEMKDMQPMVGTGCKACDDTGYKGRVALYEVLSMNDELKELVLNGASTAELKQDAIRLGMRTLRQAAILKLKEGTTTVDEVMRVSARD